MPIYASIYNAIGDATQEILQEHDIDVAALEAALATANSRINTNETAINTNATITSQLQNDLIALEAVVVNNGADIVAVEAAVAAVESSLAQVNIDLSGLETSVANNTSAISANSAAISQNASDIVSVQNSVASIQADVSAVTGDIAANTAAIASNDTDIAANAAAIAQNAADIVSATQDVTNLTATVNSNTAAISGNTSDITALQGRVTTAEANIVSNDADIATNAANIASNTTDIANVQATVNTATANIASNTSAIAGLDTRLTTAEGDIVTNAGAITSLTATVNGYAADIAANTSAIASNDVDIATNAADIAAIQADVSAVTGDIAALQTSVATNTSNISLNTTAIDTNATDINTLTTRMDSVEGVSTQLQIDVASNTSAIASNDVDIADLQSQINFITSNTDPAALDSLTEIVSAFQSADSSLNGAITTLASDSATADAALQAQIDTNATNIATNTADIATLNSEATALSNQVDANTLAIQSNDADITALQTSVSTNTTSIATNASDITALDVRVTTNEGDIATNAADIATLDTRLTTAEGNIVSNDADIAALQTAVAGNSSSITALESSVTTNTAAISNNSTSIALNTADIATNAAGIAQNAADIAAIVQYSDALVDTYLQSGGVTSINFENATSLSWNAGEGTLEFPLNPNVTLQIGQEQHVYARNLSGGSITNGTVVRVTGASGAKITVDVADNTLEGVSSTTIGVATEDINNNATGYITTNGLVGGIDTSAFAEGDALYLGTNGALTNVKPVTPAHLVLIGWVVRSSVTEGSIFVAVRNGWELEELHNVDINAVAANDLIRYNGTYWENWTPDYATISYVDAADAVLQSQVTANATAITGLDTRLTTAEADITANSAAISGNSLDIVQIQSDLVAIDGDVVALEARVTTNEASISTNSTNIATNASDITALDTRVTTNEGDIASLDTRVTTLEGAGSGGSSFETGMVVQKNTAPLTGTWLPLDGMTYDSSLYPALSGTPGYPETAGGFGALQSSVSNNTAVGADDYQVVSNLANTGVVFVSKTTNTGYYTTDGVTLNPISLGGLAQITAAWTYGVADANLILVADTNQNLWTFDPTIGNASATNTGNTLATAISTSTLDTVYGQITFATDNAGTFVYIPDDTTSTIIAYNTIPYDLSSFTTVNPGVSNVYTVGFNSSGDLWVTGLGVPYVVKTSDFAVFTDMRTGAGTVNARPFAVTNPETSLVVLHDFSTSNYSVYDEGIGWVATNVVQPDGNADRHLWIYVQGSGSLWIRSNYTDDLDLYYTANDFDTISTATGPFNTLYSAAVIGAGEVVMAQTAGGSNDGLLKLTFATSGSTFDVPNVASTIPGYTYYVKAD